jgi:hypothetical protein
MPVRIYRNCPGIFEWMQRPMMRRDATLGQSLSATFSHALYILLANVNFYMLNLVTIAVIAVL